MKLKIVLLSFVISCVLAGCSSKTSTVRMVSGPHQMVKAQNDLFLQQKTYDPWVLTSNDPNNQIPAYLAGAGAGILYDPSGPIGAFLGGEYDSKGVIVSDAKAKVQVPASLHPLTQQLNLKTGVLVTNFTNGTQYPSYGPHSAVPVDWPTFWKKSDIAIVGDPEAQQVTHAELFYLCSSVKAGSDHSIPPMGLSSSVYLGHIFWDAEIWMMPALLPQHPDLARSIIDYRFTRLSAAEELAKEHGFAGAEYPWESAATGLEEAPAEFSHERHITADVAYAAWQYYLWTGDKFYLQKEGWPILSATANYWVSRAKLGADGKYHIANVMGPDETAGLVTDNAWTNAIAQYNLTAAEDAAAATGSTANPKWKTVAKNMYVPYDSKNQIFLEYPAMDRDRGQAKQADTQMLIYPLNYPMSRAAESNTLDYYLKHTIQFGPAMTSSINAVVAARLGRGQQSLDLYRDSYRPFMRGPWDAFSEKRTKSDVYFTTGMGGNLQVTLYGFAGLNLTSGGRTGQGSLIARDGDASLYASPHLPPGWTGITVNGIHFRDKTYTLTIKQGNSVTVRTGS
jgi:trehalose/maltose hydrolase-like predicted phosphorylase